MKNFVLTLSIAVVFGASGFAAEWGTITGRFVLDGDVPKPELLHAKGAPVKDGTVCAAQDTYKDDLVVDPETKGIAHVFVYLYKAPADVHPDLAPSDANVIFDQEKCVFKPHTLVLQAGQTVEVLNSDTIAHNTHTYPFRNQAENILVAPETKKGEGVEIATAVKEIQPHEVKCDYHTYMKAYWLVLDHPYAAVTDSKGNFTIKNLPAGKHELRVWHERAGYITRTYAVTVAAGDNELEPYSVELSKLEAE